MSQVNLSKIQSYPLCNDVKQRFISYQRSWNQLVVKMLYMTFLSLTNYFTVYHCNHFQTTILLVSIITTVCIFFFVIKINSFKKMCYLCGSDAKSSHSVSRPQQYLIGNASQLIACQY